MEELYKRIYVLEQQMESVTKSLMMILETYQLIPPEDRLERKKFIWWSRAKEEPGDKEIS